MTTYNAVVVERADIATVTGKSVAEALAAFSRFHKFAHGAEDYSAKPIFRFTIKQSDVCRVASDQLKQ